MSSGVVEGAGQPRSTIVRLIVALAGGGALVSAVDAFVFGSDGADAPTTLLFLALLTVASLPTLQFRYAREGESLNLFEAVLVPAIWALPSALLVPVVAIAVAVANSVRANAPLRTAYNAVQWAAAVAAGSIVFSSVMRGDSLTARNVLALTLAVVVSSTINQLAVGWAIHVTEGTPVRQALAGPGVGVLPGWLLGWVFNASFGLLFVTAYIWSRASTALFVLPMFALQIAYRRHASAAQLRVRLGWLRRAARELDDARDIDDAITGFLAEVRDAFGAASAELAITTNDAPVIHHEGSEDDTREVWERRSLALLLLETGARIRVVPDGSVFGNAAVVAGWREVLAAPMVRGDEVIGCLVVYDPTGLEGGDADDLVVVEVLATEAAAALARLTLLRTVSEERRKLTQLVNFTTDAGLALAQDGTILMWNDGLERITAYPAEQMIGLRFPAGLDPIDLDGKPVEIERWSQHEELPPDVQIRARSGERRCLALSYTRVPGDDRTEPMLVAVGRDVTAAREMERLQQAFAGTVAHELRTPLSPILGWATTLADHHDRLSREQRIEIAGHIQVQAEHLERLIAKLLEVSKAGGGRHERRAVIQDVVSTVARVVRDVAERHEGRRIVFDQPHAPIAARGAEIWVEQIVLNLLSNAIKYSEGQIDVQISAGDAIAIAVSDRGPGVDPRDAEVIFDLYGRTDAAADKDGSGLGLFIARQLARAIGGSLELESEPGRGSTFVLTLQAVSPAAVAQ